MATMCSNVECSYSRRIKGNFCPECGSKTIEVGIKESFRLTSAKRNPETHQNYVPIEKGKEPSKTEKVKIPKTQWKKYKEDRTFNNIVKTTSYIFGGIGFVVGILVGFIIGAIIGLFIGVAFGLIVGFIIGIIYKIIKH
jgi:F0F1-type ATP synthase assembly protein I